MIESMPGKGSCKALLIAGGVAIPAIPLILFTFPQGEGTAVFGVAWSIVWLVAYLTAAWAYRSAPENLAARRLLAFASLSMVFQPLSFLGVGLYLEYGETLGVAALNFAMTVVYLLGPAALLATLATYPDGEFQCRSERWLPAAAVIAAFALPTAALLVGPDPVVSQAFYWQAQTGDLVLPSFGSLLELDGLGWISGAAGAYGETALGICAGIGVVMLALRFRRFRGQERARLQIRWVGYAALVMLFGPICFALAAIGAITPFTRDFIGLFVLSMVPASLAIGIARPKLFDVDRAARRGAVYLMLWATVGAIYAALAAALGVAVRGENIQIAVALAIVATAAFEPIRRQIVDRVTRRLFGPAVSGEELVRRLGATLASTMDLDELGEQIAITVQEGLSAEWVRVEIEGHAPIRLDGEVPAGSPFSDTLQEELLHDGKRLGRIVCGPRGRSPVERNDAELLHTLARQAALAIHNARLASELERRLEEIGAQADELAASRTRLVAAEERARRQIERDIHDGVQQELVALIARMGIARSQLGRDPGAASEMLTELQAETAQAVEHLRELAAGIHPSVLTDHGLIDAIEMRSSRLPIGVTIEMEPRLRELRFGEAIEGAMYFFASECLTNAVKHGGGERATVRLALIENGEAQLRIAISDDGRGFEAAVTELRGLAGLRDRIEALGGTLQIESEPGRGTEVAAQLPAPARVDA